MEVGLALPAFDFSIPGERALRFEKMLAWGERAEALGFGSVWLPDHLFLSIEKYGGQGTYGAIDPLVGLAALACRTERVRMGTLVLCAQLRPPGVLAKALATIDRLSNGRLVAGLGAGWFAPEYEAAGIPFERPGVRLQQLALAVDALREILSGKSESAPCLPPPVQQPSPPLWVGGTGDRLLELVAAHADGWNAAWTWTVDAWKERNTFLDAACEKAGRDGGDIERSVGLYALAGENDADLARRWERMQALSPAGTADARSLDEWRQGHLVGTVEEVRDQVGRWRDAGVGSLVVGAGALSFAIASPDDVELLASACTLEG